MKNYIISDCHGNIEGLMRALVKLRLFDKHGNRQLANRHNIYIAGDAANCVEDSKKGDIAILEMVGDTIDGMVMGNHEIPYLDSENRFGGFYHYPKIQRIINSLMDDGLIHAAIQVGNSLLSHAGISAQFLSVEDNLEYAIARINDHWNARNYNYSWFSSIGYARGGRYPVGGIFWCDFDDEFMPTRFPQIVGHTPRGVRMKGNAICIDVGAKDSDTEPFILQVKT